MADRKSKGTEQRLSLDKIKRARDVQPRVAMDKTVVAEYGDRLEAKDKLPPVVVFFDGEDYWLAEGFHRVAAHEKAGRKQIDCVLCEGTKEDAQWHALQSNKTHGLRRTNEDKAKAVMMAPEHPKGKDLSDRQIADLVGVSPTLVGKHRKAVEPTVHNGQSKTRVDRKGRKINTANIGKNKKAKPSKQSTTEKAAASPPAESTLADPKDVWPLGGRQAFNVRTVGSEPDNAAAMVAGRSAVGSALAGRWSLRLGRRPSARGKTRRPR